MALPIRSKHVRILESQLARHLAIAPGAFVKLMTLPETRVEL